MKKNIVFIFLLITILPLNLISQSFIVKFKNEKSAKNFIQSSNLVLTNLFNFDYKSLKDRIQNDITFNPNLYFKLYSNNQQLINSLASNTDIEYIEPNYVYRLNQAKYNDSLYSYQWSIDMVNARKIMQNYSGKGVRIAIVDSGIDFYHPELKNQFAINLAEDLNNNGTFEPWNHKEIRNGTTGDLNGIDDDGNGYIDDVIGYDFVDLDYTHFGDWRTPDPIPDDEAGHGTNVASIIAAEGNNKIGIVGLANKSKILNVRAFDITGNGETDDIANAIIYSAIRGVDIINMSFGDYFSSYLLEDAIKFALSMGCILVASAGNDDKAIPHYPSDYKDVISVGSIGKNSKKSGFSNWGINLSLLAPGEEIITCESGGGFGISSGTSFSAPFVSAAIALYLEKFSKSNATEIRSHLEATATKLSPQGWLFRSAAGVLDVANFLDFNGLSNVEINNIQNYSSFVSGDSLEISFNAITPLFKSAQLEVAELNTNNFVPLAYSNSKQINNEKVKVNLSKFKTDISLTLKVELNNGQILRRQRAIRLINIQDSLKILYKNITSAIKNGKRVILVSARTNIETIFSIEYYHQDYPNKVYQKVDLESKDKNHLLVLDNLLIPGKYKGNVYVQSIAIKGSKSEVISYPIEFDFDYQIFPTQNVVQKNYKLPRAYLNNRVLDLYQKNTEQVVINDLSNFVIENAKIYEFKNNSFSLMDTLKDWIPIAFGNVNGNNLTDILMTYNGKMQITEPKNIGQSPFGKAIYQSNFSLVEWGESFFDLDGDGLDEVIGYNDSSYFALKYNKSTDKYQVIARTKLPDKLKNKGLTKSSIVSDLDGDGKPELVHSNYYGHIFIYEFDRSNNSFNLEFVDSTNYGYSNPFLTIIKNKDGSKEIIIATYGTENLFGETGSNNQLWNIRAITSNSTNAYKVTNIENIMGVRAGIDPRIKVGFRNGLLGADIDKDGQEELIISTLPNTYLLKKINNKWQPYWHYPYSFTNSAIVWDFDKNGVNEIAIATFDSTKFFELPVYQKIMAAPQFYDAYTLTNDMAVMKWTKVPNTHFYRVYKIIQNDLGEYYLQQISKTDIDSIVVTNLKPKEYHHFIVTSVDTTSGINESTYSEILTIYANSPIFPIRVSPLNNKTIMLSFNGKVKPILNDKKVFVIRSIGVSDLYYPSSIIAYSDSSYILTLETPISRGEYEIICNSFRDFWNNPSLPSSIYFEIADVITKNEMYLKSLETKSLTNLTVEFSEELDIQTAESIENYSIQPIGKILDVKLDLSNRTKVNILLNDDIKNSNIIGDVYSITVRKVHSSKGTPITTGAGNTLSFTLVKDNIDAVFSFPNPVSISKDEYLGFGNLPKEFEITIMTTEGKILQKLSDNKATGAIKWDLKDDNNKKLPIGRYLYKVTGKNQKGEVLEFQINKFAVIP